MIGDSLHTNTSPIIKHKAKVIMNLNNYTYIRRKRGGEEGLLHPIPLRVGGMLHIMKIPPPTHKNLQFFSIVYVSKGRLT
jgi:hypothetical protein